MSLLLKTCPLVDELALYDVVNTPGVAADLSHISSVAVCANATSFSRSPHHPHQTSTWNFGLLTFFFSQKISGFLPKDDGLKNALTGTDIVVIPAGIPRQ